MELKFLTMNNWRFFLGEMKEKSTGLYSPKNEKGVTQVEAKNIKFNKNLTRP
mgnify:CR=1 FL=1